MRDFLFDTPYWFLGLLGLAGIALFLSGNARQEARLRGERLDLTPTEYKLLYHLVRNAGHVLQHGTLLAKVWGREYVDEVDYIRVYIRRLRDKLGDDRTIRPTSGRSEGSATGSSPRLDIG